MKLDDLNRRMISIQVNEPWDWKYGILTGRIVQYDEKRLIIVLTKPIKGDKFSSTFLTVYPRYKSDSILTLLNNKHLTVRGELIKKDSDETDYILIGTLKL